MKTFLVAAALVGAINTERAEHGLPALQLSQDLTRSADAFAHRLVRRGQFRHDAASASNAALQPRRRGARARPRPRSAVKAWMASPPHRRLLLSPKFRLAGAGHAGKIRVLHLASRP